MREIDARGLSCPIPVLKTRDAIKESPGSALIVLVDEQTQVENVMRLGQSSGYDVKVEPHEGSFKLLLTPRK